MSKQSIESGIAHELPYWEFMAMPIPHTVLVDGSISAGLNVELVDVECLSASDCNAITSGLRSAVNSLSEGLSAQFIFSIGSDYEGQIAKHKTRRSEAIHPLIREIAEVRESILEEELTAGKLSRPRLSVYLRVRPKVNARTKIFGAESEFEAVSEDSYAQCLEELSQNLDSLKGNLERVGFKCESLSRVQLIEEIYDSLNPKRSQKHGAPKVLKSSDSELPENMFEANDWLRELSSREQLAFGDLLLATDSFFLDSVEHRIITLKTLPEETVASQLSTLLQLPFKFGMVLSFEVPPQADEMSKLNQKRRMAHSLTLSRNGQATDLESEAKLNATEELIRELIETGQRIYPVQVCFVLKELASDRSKSVLDRRSRELLSRFRSLQGAELLEESVGSWKIFRNSMVGAPLKSERPRKMKTNTLADFLPVYGSRAGNEDPVVIFRTRQNGLVGFDSFDKSLPNYNALVTGSSGAGKSFLNNCILLQELARGLRVFIIDVGGSYRKLVRSLDGEYFEINLVKSFNINPFHIPDPKCSPSNRKIKSLLACIECMTAEEGSSKLPKLDRVLLEKAIIELYDESRELGRIPVLSDLKEALQNSDEPKLRALSKMLHMWTGDSPYGQMLDGDGHIDTASSICAFDLKGLSSHPDLQSAMILILTDFILEQVEAGGKNGNRIFLDEAWELLKSPSAAAFMEYCARTLRKTGSGITFITQGIEEIVSSPIGAAILNNTATKFIMLQRGDSELLGDTLKLNTKEVDLIHSLEQRKGEFSEAFMIQGDDRQVIRVLPNSMEYWVSTSDARDNGYLSELESSGKTMIDAIREASLNYPRGYSREKAHA